MPAPKFSRFEPNSFSSWLSSFNSCLLFPAPSGFIKDTFCAGSFTELQMISGRRGSSITPLINHKSTTLLFTQWNTLITKSKTFRTIPVDYIPVTRVSDVLNGGETLSDKLTSHPPMFIIIDLERCSWRHSSSSITVPSIHPSIHPIQTHPEIAFSVLHLSVKLVKLVKSVKSVKLVKSVKSVKSVRVDVEDEMNDKVMVK